jgi:hypothetical protein
MKSQNTKSSDQLQKDVRHELRNVRKDIDELQGRLTPGQLIDDAIFYPQGRSMSSTLEHMKRNPVGTAFLSLGTIMLMEDESHQSIESSAKEKIGVAKNKIREQLPHRELTPGMIPNKADLAKSKINEMKDTLQSKVSGIREGIDEKVDTLKSKIPASSDVTQAGSETLDAAGNRVSSMLHSGKEKIQNLEPLTYMALGAGLGALTGAALPVSEAEQKFVDEKVQGKLSSFNQDLQNAINECSNILKDLVITDVKNYNVKLF